MVTVYHVNQVSDDGIQKKPGIFISRLLPGGLADSTGLLSVGDEVLEVNNISLEGEIIDIECHSYFNS